MITIIIPCYNEEGAVIQTLDKVREALKDWNTASVEIIVVNDASKDKSRELLEAYDHIKLINNPYNLGYSASLKRGILAAQGEKICIVDCDGSYPVEYIPTLYTHAQEYDMVVGARSLDSEGQEWIKKYPKKLINRLANYISPIHIPDLNSGMRIFDKQKCLNYYNLYPSRFSFTSTITLAFATHDHTIKYVPIPYHKRIGKSKMKPRDFINFLSLLARIVFYFKPLKFFTPTSLAILAAGTTYATYQILSPNHNLGEASILIILAGLQLFFMGFIAELIVRHKA